MTPSNSEFNRRQANIDLSAWLYLRVLARQDSVYVAGIVHSIIPTDTISVEFDYPPGSYQMFNDLLGDGRHDIIMDTNPSFAEIKNGSSVLISSQPNQRHTSFIKGEVNQILHDTKQFVVRIIDSDIDKTVPRAHIRLLQPPWWEELNNANMIQEDPLLSTMIQTPQSGTY